ncbi:hypothetical protein FWD07_02635 [Candidatus Saccharibacteria bacterium]|nr:hypothetical protein [Candidatus Saccharibacteria bacterium]
MNKEALKKTILQHNSPDFPFEFAVNGDSITGYWNWTDAKWFTPGTVTEEQRLYNFTITLLDNNTYLEHEKHAENYREEKDNSLKGIMAKVGIKDDDGNISSTARVIGQNPDDIRGPLRDLLKRGGWKKANFITTTIVKIKDFFGIQSKSTPPGTTANTQIQNPAEKIGEAASQMITPAAPPTPITPTTTPPDQTSAPAPNPQSPATPPSFDPSLIAIDNAEDDNLILQSLRPDPVSLLHTPATEETTPHPTPIAPPLPTTPASVASLTPIQPVPAPIPATPQPTPPQNTAPAQPQTPIPQPAVQAPIPPTAPPPIPTPVQQPPTPATPPTQPQPLTPPQLPQQ